jgi:ubiquinone/menaquinone biosynthesis C-methylase UbiE
MKKIFQEKTSAELTGKVQSWWNQNPFTYLMDNQNITPDWAFYRNIDRKIIKWMPWAQKGYPLLSSVVDYSRLTNKKVLDIAVGTGWSTEQLVRAGARVTAIDLTPRAVELTKKRLEINHISAESVQVADAQSLPFADATFDFVLAFGCLMHMPNTQKAIDEIHRVLKAGGRSSAMMYYKHSLHWWYYIFFGKGILRGKLLKMSPQELSNRYTDGAYEEGNQLTKFYSKSELRKMFGKFSKTNIRIFDTTTPIDHLPHRYFPLGTLIPRPIKQWLTTIVGQTVWVDVEK